MNTLKREALLGDNYSSKDTSRNIRIILEVANIAPLMVLSQTDGNGSGVRSPSSNINTVEYNRSYQSVLVTTDEKSVPNAVVGIENEDRYTLIGEISSITTKDVFVIVWDSDYRDFLLFPALNGYGEGAFVDALANETYTVRAIAYKPNVTSIQTPFANPNENVVVNEDIDIAKPQLKTKTHLMHLRGIEKYSISNNFGYAIDDVYFESTATNVMQLVSLGSLSDLFVNEKLCFGTFMQDGVNSSKLVYTKPTDADDILIPLPF